MSFLHSFNFDVIAFKNQIFKMFKVNPWSRCLKLTQLRQAEGLFVQNDPLLGRFISYFFMNQFFLEIFVKRTPSQMGVLEFKVNESRSEFILEGSLEKDEVFLNFLQFIANWVFHTGEIMSTLFFYTVLWYNYNLLSIFFSGISI